MAGYSLRVVKRSQYIGEDRLKTILDSYGRGVDKASADARAKVLADAEREGWVFTTGKDDAGNVRLVRAEILNKVMQLCREDHDDSTGGMPDMGSEKKNIPAPTQAELDAAWDSLKKDATESSRGLLGKALNNGLSLLGENKSEIPMAGKRTSAKEAVQDAVALTSEFFTWAMADPTRMPAIVDFQTAMRTVPPTADAYLRNWKAGLPAL